MPPRVAGPAVSKLWWFTGPVLALLIGAISALLARPAPYVALTPGSARAVEPLVTITDGPDVRPEIDAEAASDESLLFVTVSVRRPSGIEALIRVLDDTNEVLPAQLIDGGQSREENRSFNLQLMTDSKDKAAKVALERAGFTVDVETDGAVVLDLAPAFPVADVVRPGDTIVGADGTEIAMASDLVDVIAGREPGDPLTLDVVAFGQDEARTVDTTLGTNPETGAAQLGVSLDDRPAYTFPFEVAIDSGEVGGPSAGLAFTLAILDQLTAGDLTGEGVVAVTGTIELDGSVGPVGGVLQKTEAAIDAGAKVFLVPPDEFADAMEAARGRIEVRQVASLDEAVAALESTGGDPIPTVDPGGAGTGG